MKVDKATRWILSTNTKARNSDKELLIGAMKLHDVHLTHQQEEKIRSMPAFESFTRARRIYQHNGEFLADEDIKRHRIAKASSMKYSQASILGET